MGIEDRRWRRRVQPAQIAGFYRNSFFDRIYEVVDAGDWRLDGGGESDTGLSAQLVWIDFLFVSLVFWLSNFLHTETIFLNYSCPV